MNERLFLAIKRQGLHQYQLANMAEISEARLSKILWGRARPSERVKRQIASALRTPVEELFEEEAIPAKRSA